jgi:flagellar FliL protein
MTSATEEVAPVPARGLASRRNLIIGGAAVLLIIALGGGYMMLGGSADGHVVAEEAGPEVAPAFFINLPDITVNLSTVDARASFVRLSVSLQVPEERMIAEIQPQLPRVLDAFQVYLRELRMSDLQGSAGLFRLKEELQRRINIAVYPAHVDEVLFRSLVVQ